jgi:NAD(P)-dependent dehydrogenase (short-subunit alcohol dehydrogenase family)
MFDIDRRLEEMDKKDIAVRIMSLSAPNVYLWNGGTSHLEAYSYAASKAAILHLTRMMAKYLAKNHIAVNAIAPGYFPSRMTDAIPGEESEVIEENTPMRRWGRPEDMAGVALYLASRASGFVCGSTVVADGGLATTG